MTRGARLLAGGRELVPLAAFLALVALIDLADWNEGATRAAGLALAAGGLLWLWRAAPFFPAAAPGWLGVAVALALLRAAASLTSPEQRAASPNDIGWTTAHAIEARAAGASPYASLVDPQRILPRQEPGFGWFMGYKYGPVVPAYYRPFLQRFGVADGLYLGNALLLALAAALAAVLAGQVGGTRGVLAALAALLWPELARQELFRQGVNDLLPTVFGLGALLVATQPGRAASAFSGALLGLSLAAKPLPGALLLLLLPGAVAAAAPFAAGLALGVLPYLPDLLATPRELAANLVLFNFVRPGDSTGAVSALPGWLPGSSRGLASGLVQLLALGLAASAAVAYHRSRRTPRDLILAAALVTTAFLAGGKLIHRNYLLWWLPLAAAALGACYRAVGAPDLGRRR